MENIKELKQRIDSIIEDLNEPVYRAEILSAKQKLVALKLALNIDLVIWRCTHTILDIDGDNAFTKGNIYEELNGWLVDNNAGRTELSLFEDNFTSI
tara:strand:- start:377 stop:667 length:291 start_codon:yes stop_codon:yes gene_type:complete